MDKSDVAILRCLGLQPFLTWPHGPEDLKPRVIAERLGMSVDAVRDRIARLEEQRIIAGYEMVPNPRLFGLGATTYHFRLPDGAGRDARVEELGKGEGVWTVTCFTTRDVCIDVMHRDEAELGRRVKALSREIRDPSPYNWFNFPLPAPRREPSPLDWRILAALRRDPKRALAAIAADLGVSERTVKRRYDRLAADAAFDVAAVIDPGAFSGQMLIVLLLQLREDVTDAEERAVLNAFTERWFFGGCARPAGSRAAFVAVLARSAAEADAMRREAESAPGVDHVEVLVPAAMVRNTTWVDDALAERVAATARRKDRAAPPIPARQPGKG